MKGRMFKWLATLSISIVALGVAVYEGLDETQKPAVWQPGPIIILVVPQQQEAQDGR